MSTKHIPTLGIIASISASIFFALMPIYIQFLPTDSGYAATGQRIIWTSIFILLILLSTRQLSSALQPLFKISYWPGLLAGSLLVGIQWFIFIWAPLNGETLGLSQGYFLLPLTLVLMGKFVLGEQLSSAKKLAFVFASLAIGYNLWVVGHFSWVAIVIAVGYPIYFLLRRKQPIPVLSAFFIENLLLFPIAWWACIYYGQVNHPFEYSAYGLLWFFGLGILGSSGMLCMLYASRKLPVALFGLLGYIEPPLIMAIGVLALNEKILVEEVPTYMLISLALVVLSLDGLRKLRKMKQQKKLRANKL